MTEEGLLSPDEALDIILSSIPSTGTERLDLRSVLGRILAEDIYSDLDLPPFHNSAMDGYAVIADSVRGATRDSPTLLDIIAEEPAGTVTSAIVRPGTAVAIMTGAPIPSGADAVVVVEDTKRCNGQVRVYREVRQGSNIRLMGEDVKRDQLIVSAGTAIGPAEMGMLAALGKAEVQLHARPRVAIITTGREVVDITQRPGPGQIRDSNQYSILGQALSAGAEIAVIARAGDERDELLRVLTSAAEISDVIITSGGVSVGDFDFVKETLSTLGDISFWRVAIKPGKPLAYGHINGKPLFGLPGNPVSSMVTFDLFVRPALLRMAGAVWIGQTVVSGKVSQRLRHKVGRREFVRATTTWDGAGYLATPTGDQGSGRLSSMLGANSYVMVREDTGDVAAGESVDIVLLDQGVVT